MPDDITPFPLRDEALRALQDSRPRWQVRLIGQMWIGDLTLFSQDGQVDGYIVLAHTNAAYLNQRMLETERAYPEPDGPALGGPGYRGCLS